MTDLGPVVDRAHLLAMALQRDALAAALRELLEMPYAEGVRQAAVAALADYDLHNLLTEYKQGAPIQPPTTGEFK